MDQKRLMYCNQCEETAFHKACTMRGVCGKVPELANKLDLLKEYLKVLSANRLANHNATDADKHFIMHSLFKLITNANFNIEAIDQEIAKAKELTGVHEGITPYYEADPDLYALKNLVITGLMGMAAYHSHAYNLGFESQEVHTFTMEALAKVNDVKTVEDMVKLIDETGAHGVMAMELLDKANTTTYGNPEISEVQLGVGKRPGILISGHDFHDLKQLLEQSKDAGIDIYTHSEMLPAHYYPELKKYEHLIANYGNAWWKQVEEFQTFSGPILFTTNCIVPPRPNANYTDRLYATGDCDHPGFKRIEVQADGTKDFSDIINHAKQTKPPKAIESGSITGGFAHHQVLALADKIIEEIKAGNIRKFVVMSGCDGRKPERAYYTNFAKGLPEDVIILTSGCAKYRYNKLNLGDINGIPRVLDAGQCNDSYSWVVVANALVKAFDVASVNELPIVFNIAWYEQKAIIVLLSLLHLGIGNICAGPDLPGYFTPTVETFLKEHHGLRTIKDVDADLKEMLA
ncbi:hydroxylamine reductase [Erysipelotrichaceae bacterium MTC7]|nr:hydroxylamine reductase [Erysipelotrichaceae bacterium MTC7]